MGKKKYFIILFVILFTFVIALMFANVKVKEYSKVFNYFDSYQEIRIYTYSEKKANEAFKYIDNLLNEYEFLTSTKFMNGNNTYILNRSDDVLEIDSKLYDLIKYGDSLNKLSNGYININSYEFTSIFNKAKIKKSIPDYKKINLNKINLLSNNMVDASSCYLDFSSIVKLYVGNLIKEKLEEDNISCYTINFLGSAIVGENKNSSFKVAIEKPFTDASEIIAILSLNNKSISTVGAYQNYYKVDDDIYHSLIDYNTKKMVTLYDSVTVIDDSASEANMLSYMLYFVNIEEGQKLLDLYDAYAMWYTLDGKIIYSNGMESFVSKWYI